MINFLEESEDKDIKTYISNLRGINYSLNEINKKLGTSDFNGIEGIGNAIDSIGADIKTSSISTVLLCGFAILCIIFYLILSEIKDIHKDIQDYIQTQKVKELPKGDL